MALLVARFELMGMEIVICSFSVPQLLVCFDNDDESLKFCLWLEDVKLTSRIPKKAEAVKMRDKSSLGYWHTQFDSFLLGEPVCMFPKLPGGAPDKFKMARNKDFSCPKGRYFQP